MEVILFTMEGCPHCTQLKKILNERKISFIEKDVDKNKEIYDNFSKIVKSDYLPAALIGKKAFIPDQSFKTMDQAGRLIENYLLGLSHRGNHLG